MRISPEIQTFLKEYITDILPKAEVYLFGSRVDESKKGGDIDVLILGERSLEPAEKTQIRIAFIKKFGDQKLDLVSYRYDETDAFKDFILSDAHKL